MFAKFEDVAVGNGIEHSETLLASFEDTGFGQGLKVSGGVGLGETGEVGQFSNARFPVAEGLDEFESIGFAQYAEAGGDQFEGLGGEAPLSGFR